MDKCPIKPLDYAVVLKVPKVEEKTEGGIVLLEKQVDREQGIATDGIILRMGERAFELLKNPPQVGDKVFYKKYSGIDKTIGETVYRIINDDDIYASFEELEEATDGR